MAVGDLTTLEAVKEWLGVELTNTDADALLGRILSATSSMVKQYLNNDIVSTEYTEVYDGFGKDWMVLRRYPVTSVIGLWFGGDSIPPANGDGKTSSWRNGFVLLESNGGNQRIVLFDKLFPNQRSSITVTYIAGYLQVPLDIQQVVWELVGSRYRMTDRIGYTSKSLGGQETVSFAPNRIDDYSLSILNQYRRVTPA